MAIQLGPAHVTPGGRYGLGVWHGLPFAKDDTTERYITSEFGAYEDFRRERGWQPHGGTDLNAPTGTLLHALAAGDVEVAGPSTWWPVAGNYVQIHHGEGLRSFYLHMDTIEVAVGDSIMRGEAIGTSGNSSSVATAPHLHLSINQDNMGDPMSGARTFLDPELVISASIDDATVPAVPVLDRETFEEFYVSQYYLAGGDHGGTRSMGDPEFVDFLADGKTEVWQIQLLRPKAERPA